jgi:hypothetical protein
MRVPICTLLAVLWLGPVSASRVQARQAGSAGDTQPAPTPRAGADSSTLLYADFERLENGRPVSARGGLIQMFA